VESFSGFFLIKGFDLELVVPPAILCFANDDRSCRAGTCYMSVVKVLALVVNSSPVFPTPIPCLTGNTVPSLLPSTQVQFRAHPLVLVCVPSFSPVRFLGDFLARTYDAARFRQSPLLRGHDTSPPVLVLHGAAYLYNDCPFCPHRGRFFFSPFDPHPVGYLLTQESSREI